MIKPQQAASGECSMRSWNYNHSLACLEQKTLLLSFSPAASQYLLSSAGRGISTQVCSQDWLWDCPHLQTIVIMSGQASMRDGWETEKRSLFKLGILRLDAHTLAPTFKASLYEIFTWSDCLSNDFDFVELLVDVNHCENCHSVCFDITTGGYFALFLTQPISSV